MSTRGIFLSDLRYYRDIRIAWPRLMAYMPDAIASVVGFIILWALWFCHLYIRLPIQWMVSECGWFSVKGKAEAQVVLILMMPQMMLHPRWRSFAAKKIIESSLYLNEKYKLDVIALGALTPCITDRGRAVAEAVGKSCLVTHGDTYSVRLTLDSIERVIEYRAQHNQSCTNIVVVGATGVIGTAICKYLDEQSLPLYLVGRTKQNLQDLELAFSGNVSHKGTVDPSVTADYLSKADIAILVTNATTAHVRASDFGEGPVDVIDCAQPSNLDSTDRAAQNIRYHSGGMAFISTLASLKLENTGNPQGVTFGCLTETLLLLLMIADGRKNFPELVGPINLPFMVELKKYATNHGVGVAEQTLSLP